MACDPTRRCRASRDASGRPGATSSCSPTTTTSGACRRTTTATSSRCSRSKARRPGSRGRRSCASARATGAAFAGFDPTVVARFSAKDVERLLADPGIVRNRLKVESTVNNAARVLEVQDELRQPRRLPLVVRRRRADRQPLALARGAPGRDGALDGDLEGPEAARLPLRRPDGDATRSCSRSAWSTTTRWTASGARSQRDHVREVDELDRGAEGRDALGAVLDLRAGTPQLLRRHEQLLDPLGRVRVPVRRAPARRSPRARSRRSRRADAARASAPPSRCTGGSARTSAAGRVRSAPSAPRAARAPRPRSSVARCRRASAEAACRRSPRASPSASRRAASSAADRTGSRTRRCTCSGAIWR